MIDPATGTASTSDPKPGVGSYSLGYYAAWINAAIGVVAGVLAAAFLTVHPSWLTSDLATTAGIIVPITVGLAALLPQLGRSPANREASYLRAMVGVLPADLTSKKHDTTLVPAGTPDPTQLTPKPFDTLPPV